VYTCIVNQHTINPLRKKTINRAATLRNYQSFKIFCGRDFSATMVTIASVVNVNAKRLDRNPQTRIECAIKKKQNK
jgi:hypothetical protein